MKKYFYLPAALIFALTLAACFNQPQTVSDANQNRAAPDVQIAPSRIDLAKPLAISTKPEDVALAGKIDELIEKSEFAGARWGVFVVSLADGRVVAARDAQKLFTPASALKIITSVVALDRLGADFRWKTRVFAKGDVAANGTL